MTQHPSPEPLDIRRLAGAAEAKWCARVMSGSEPWITLGRGYDESLRVVTHPDREVYVAHAAGAPGAIAHHFEAPAAGREPAGAA